MPHTWSFEPLLRRYALLTRHALPLSCAPLCLLACSVYDPSLLEPAAQDTTSVGDVGGSAGASSTTTSSTSEATTAGGSSTTTNSSSTTDSTSAGGATSSTSDTTSTTAAGGSGNPDCSDSDCCPDDPDKTDPGECGCGASETDSDADGSPDCVDNCADDPNKTEPGECGCGVRDLDDATGAGCVNIRNGLTHRYSFEESGAQASDTQGTAHGNVIGTTLDGSGQMVLDAGGVAEYVELPAGIVSALTNATVEAWFSYENTESWQRVFDFGSQSQAGSGDPMVGQTYLFFTPKVGNQSGTPRAIYTNNGLDGELLCAGSLVLPRNEMLHMALAIDTVGDTMTLYINGTFEAARAFPGSLSELSDTNNWLGRSQFEVDPGFAGSIDEFRIYGVALTSQQVTFSLDAGPNPAFLE